jgi:hypothetical protein
VAWLTATSRAWLTTLHVLLFQAAPGATFQEMAPADGAGALVSLASLALAAFVCARLTRRERVLRIVFDVAAMAALAWAEAFALDGAALTAAWAGQAVVLARVAVAERDELARYGSFAFLGLGMVHAVGVEASPVLLDAGGAEALAAAGGLGALAAGLVACARVMPSGSDDRGVLVGLSAAALAYLAPFVLGGPALVAVWAAGAVALTGGARLLRTVESQIALLAGAVWFGLAGLHVVAYDAPPNALVDGVAELPPALAAAGALAVALLGASRLVRPGDAAPLRLGLEATGAVAAIYAVSVAIVSSFPPDAAGFDPAVTGLGVRQQGQMLLSAFWAGAGLLALVWGLLHDERSRRVGGLALLTLALAKVFLYDLAALDSIYRVVSFIALGVLLLIGAFAYQRMRPAAEAH